jgi:hypothetical protein
VVTGTSAGSSRTLICWVVTHCPGRSYPHLPPVVSRPRRHASGACGTLVTRPQIQTSGLKHVEDYPIPLAVPKARTA